MIIKKEYVEMVANKAKPGADILATLTAADAHTLHMFVGTGELFELHEAAVKRAGIYREQENLRARPALAARTGAADALKARYAEANQEVLKELGDILFYRVGLVLEFKIPSPAIVPYVDSSNSIDDLILLLGGSLARAQDSIKRQMIYRGKYREAPLLGRLNQALSDALCQFDRIFEVLTSTLGFTVEAVQLSNMEKLGVRFAGGFSEDEAHARRDVVGTDDVSAILADAVKPKVEEKAPEPEEVKPEEPVAKEEPVEKEEPAKPWHPPTKAAKKAAKKTTKKAAAKKVATKQPAKSDEHDS